MSNDSQRELIKAAHVLSRCAPQQWEDFGKAFASYVSSKVEEAVQASPELAQTTHGRAQSLIALRTIFQELKVRYETIEKKSR